MTALYIILSVFAVIMILLLFPIRIFLFFDGTMKLEIKYLFFSIYPRKKKEKDKNTQKEPEEISKEVPDKKEKSVIAKYKEEHGLNGLLDLIKNMVLILTDTFQKTAKHLKISKLEINLIVVGEDAADTAIKFGQSCAVIFPAVSLIENGVKKCVHKEDISPGFLLDKTKYELTLKAEIQVIFLVGILISEGIKLLKAIAKK